LPSDDTRIRVLFDAEAIATRNKALAVEIKAAAATIQRMSDMTAGRDDPVWLMWTPDAGVALDH